MRKVLSQRELEDLFNSRVVPDYLEPQENDSNNTGVHPPRFISVGGQPGAGKGGVLNQMQMLHPGAVVVNGDDLRLFHPDYGRLMREDPIRMPDVTAPASGPWVGMSNAYLRAQRLSAIVETTLRDAKMLLAEFRAFKDAGYETQLRVVAAPLEVSRLGTVSRYVEQIKDYGAGRWTPSAAHDEAAMNVGKTVFDLVSSGLLDRVTVQNRDRHVFYEANISNGGTENSEAAVDAIDRARDTQNLSVAQAKSWVQIGIDSLTACARLSEKHDDLAQTVNRIASVDAAAVVPQAYPGDSEKQLEVLEGFKELSAKQRS